MKLMARNTRITAPLAVDVTLYLFGVVCGLLVFHEGAAAANFHAVLAGVLVVFFTGVLLCLLRLRRRFLGLIFYGMIFLFLLSRSSIAELRGEEWWERYTQLSNLVALRAVTVSMVAITLGMFAAEWLESQRARLARRPFTVSSLHSRAFTAALRVALGVCFACLYAREIDKLLFMYGRVYTDYYTEYRSSLSMLVLFPAGCTEYFLCALLALRPKKKETVAWLGLYLLAQVPMLLIGARGQIMLAVLFALCYFCLRSAQGDGWIGRKEKLLVVLSVPLFILFLGSYDYIRKDESVSLSPGQLVLDFAYKQGTTYDTVLQGYTYRDEIPGGYETKHYTFSAITYYVKNNVMGQVLFDPPAIGEGNSEAMGTQSNLFAHNISYVVYRDRYLAGEGRGSSYIIETFLDGGYAGVAVFSLLLGLLLGGCALGFGRNFVPSFLTLCILQGIFWIPRGEALSFLTFFFSYKFWICVLGIMAFTVVLEYPGLTRAQRRKW